MMKKRTKKTVSRVISGALAALFLIGIGLLGLSGLGSIHAKACDFELDEGSLGLMREHITCLAS